MSEMPKVQPTIVESEAGDDAVERCGQDLKDQIETVGQRHMDQKPGPFQEPKQT